MRIMLRPIGVTAMLVGIAFIFCYLYLPLCTAEENSTAPKADVSLAESLNQMKDFHSKFTDPSSDFRTVKSQGPTIPIASGVKDESTVLTGPSEERVSGLISLNGNKHRSVAFDGALDGARSNINSMDIEVSRITVIAINTVKGGSAVATSDIVLSPVQSSGGSSSEEVGEKLR